MVKQATDHLNSIGASLRDTNASIQQASENFQTTVAQAKAATRVGRRRRRNGYDGDTENASDRRTGSKPTKILSLHV